MGCAWLRRSQVKSFSALASLSLLAAPPLLARDDDGAQTVLQSTGKQKQETQAAVEFALEPIRFELPPRSITDITELIERHRATNEAERSRFRQLAETEPPAGAKPLDLARFYYQRANAAGEIGRPAQQIADLEHTLAHLEQSNMTTADVRVDSVLMALSHAHAYSGDLERAIEHRQQSIERAEHDALARRAMLAFYLLGVGDLAGAKRVQGAYLTLEPTNRWRGDARKYRNITLPILRWGDGKIAEATGDFEDAERLMREGLEIIDSDEGYDDLPLGIYNFASARTMIRASIRGNLARLLARRGRSAEAELEARHALRLHLERFGKHSVYTIESLLTFSEILLEQGRDREAEALARTALEIVTTVGASSSSASNARARQALARALALQEDWEGASAEFERLAADLSPQSRLYEARYRGDPDWALALLLTGRGSEALANLAAPLRKRREQLGDEHYDVAELRGLAAIAEYAANRREAALEGFLAAVPVLIEQAQTAGGGISRARRRVAIYEAFLALLADLQGTALEARLPTSAAAEAFRVAEAARGQSLERALAASAARAVLSGPGMNPELVRLARAEQDARQQIESYQKLIGDTLASGVEEPRLGSIIRKLRERIEGLREVQRRQHEEIDRVFPEYAALIHPRPASLAEAAAELRANEALVSFYVGRNRSYVWAVDARGESAFAAAALGGAKLSAEVGRLRAALDPDVETLADIPPFDLETAHRLYQALLAPLKGRWGAADHLVVVAHGALESLPLGVLATEPVRLGADASLPFSAYRSVPWLARHYNTMRLPSATSLIALRRSEAKRAAERAFAGFGDPVFAHPEPSGEGATRGALHLARRATPDTRGAASAGLDALPRLPATAEEILSIAEVLGADVGRDVFLRTEASEDRVKRLSLEHTLSTYRVVSFATHGLVAGDLDGLTEPALALSSPAASGGREDGLLTIGEVLGLELNADWVVLSACNTAAAEGAGAEAVSGLGRAFFYAGSRALLVSHWPVHSEATRRLMVGVFERQRSASLTRAQALREAMLELIDEGAYEEGGRALFSYAHPLFWAPFSLVGDGGAGSAR